METLNLSALKKAFNSLKSTVSKLADEQWFEQQEFIVQDILIAVLFRNLSLFMNKALK